MRRAAKARTNGSNGLDVFEDDRSPLGPRRDTLVEWGDSDWSGAHPKAVVASLPGVECDPARVAFRNEGLHVPRIAADEFVPAHLSDAFGFWSTWACAHTASATNPAGSNGATVIHDGPFPLVRQQASRD